MRPARGLYTGRRSSYAALQTLTVRMLAIFESILPIFLLILTGVALRRMPLVDRSGWAGLEQLGYWFLYPALLFVTIYNADFSGLRLDAVLAVLVTGVVAMIALVLALAPLTARTGIVARNQFSSVFQTSVRWNGFIALAIAEKIFAPEAAAVVALAMAAIIIPVNIASVTVVSHFSAAGTSVAKTARGLATNPLILWTLLAVLLRLGGVPLYEPLNETLQLVGSAALGLGLIVVGAGLRPGDLAGLRPVMLLPTFLKLFVFPALVMALALALGVSGPELQYLALCAAVPTAMNGYLLARQLGGDADLYAAVTTFQTAVAFLSIPLVLMAAAQLSSG